MCYISYLQLIVPNTLFERYGGFAKLNRVVSSFYEKVLDSPILGKYFEKIEMRRLIDHQTKFIASLMGGPASYSDTEIERLHVRLKITEEAFTELAALLEETLEDFEFEKIDLATIMREINHRKRYIVLAN